MKIKLDENISRRLKPHLQQEGYGVFTTEEEGLLGKSDIVVGAAAKAEGMMKNKKSTFFIGFRI